MAEYYMNAVASRTAPIAMLIEEAQQETAKDSTLQAVISIICANKWHNLTCYHDVGVNPGALEVYSRVREELMVNESGDLVL